MARELRGLGWKVVTVWECQLRQPARLAARLTRELRKLPAERRKPIGHVRGSVGR